MNIAAKATRALEVRSRIGRFRVLVLGRANAGKTTLLQKVCNSTVKPEVFDAKWRKINISVIKPSSERGEHDINHQLVFRSNPGFIFHDSRGFEAGGITEWEIVRNFITSRGKEGDISEQLHAIWYCIPANDSRPITKAEENFFNFRPGTGSVPVIVIFTKLDALDRSFWDMQEPFERAKEKTISAVEKQLQRLREMKYPPNAGVYFRDLHKPMTQVKELIDATAAALNDDNLQQILASMQQPILEIWVKNAVRDWCRRIQRDRPGILMDQEPIYAQEIFREIAKYFTHFRV